MAIVLIAAVLPGASVRTVVGDLSLAWALAALVERRLNAATIAAAVAGMFVPWGLAAAPLVVGAMLARRRFLTVIVAIAAAVATVPMVSSGWTLAMRNGPAWQTAQTLGGTGPLIAAIAGGTAWLAALAASRADRSTMLSSAVIALTAAAALAPSVDAALLALAAMLVRVRWPTAVSAANDNLLHGAAPPLPLLVFA